jgi:DNA polymerase-3 subunit epsilon
MQEGRLALGKGFHGILRQDRGSSRENILVHGIGHAEQAQGEIPSKLLMEFLDYTGKAPLVAFHAAFDRGFLHRAVRKFLGVRFANPFLDLAWLLPALFGESGRSKPRGLDDWLQQFALSVPNRHSADADALAAAELLLIAVPAAKRRGLTTFDQLSALARRQEEVTRAGSPGIV